MYGKLDVNAFYQTIDELFASRQIAKAEQYMLQKLHEAGQKQDLEGIVAVCNELGGLYRAMRRTDEAMWAYEKVITGLEKLGMQEGENYASALINLGNVYITLKDYRKAYETDLRAMEIVNRTGDTYQRASLFNNMSAILRELGRTDEAQAFALHAISIIQTMPEQVAELATSYTNLGQAKAKSSLYDEARADLEYALSLYESYNGENDMHYAMAVYALANVDYEQGRYESAKEGYEKAAKLIERDFGRNRDYDAAIKAAERARTRRGE